MAQPIQLKLPPRDAKRELLKRLEEAPAEHAAALLDSYELLQKMHEQGVFSLVRGVLGATGTITEAASAGANSTEAIRAMRNAILLGKMLGSIDPELLGSITASVSETFGDVKALPARPPGLFALLGGFASRDVRYLLGIAQTFAAKFAGRLKGQRGAGADG
jgi:uncharacterized protein YjgD (DUF1641 family)